MPDTLQFHSEDDIREARSGVSDIFGKLDDEIPPIRISGDFLDICRRNARAAGCNLSEYLRNKLYVSELGIDHVRSLREQHFSRVMGNASQMTGKDGAA